MDLNEKQALAERTALAAGRFILSNRDFSVEQKAEHDFVTDMDRASERMIREALLSACPEDSFYGEEYGGELEQDGCWIVDPIDGTTNYIRNLPIYTVSIAYRYKGELVIGCVYCPVTDELFSAQLGKGATLNGEAIHSSTVSEPSHAIVGMSFSHRCIEDHTRMLNLLTYFSHLNDLRRLGSAAYDLCMVASGRFDAYLELGLNLYDIAAGMVIVREAGAIVTGWPDDSEDVTVTGNVLSGNLPIHAHLSGIIAQANSDAI